MSRARDFADLAGSADAGGITGKNLIINGAMQVAQRGTGAFTANTDYPVDRFQMLNNTSTGTFSAQQVSEYPDGFKKSLKVTVTAADTSLGSTERLLVSYPVEGSDFVAPAFGTSSAKKITLSFQVRSSLTGTFSGSVQNSAQNRSFPFEYTISSANTWETKSITIDGDTTGTWLTDTGIGLRLRFSLGCGSSQKGTVNTWASANYFGTSAETPLIGTNGATWQITGVQLEVGEQATPFEHRSFGDELARCQRYFYKVGGNGEAYGGRMNGTGNADQIVHHPVIMRATPSGSTTLSSYGFENGSNAETVSSTALNNRTAFSATLRCSLSTSGTNGLATIFQLNSGTTISLDAEL